MWINPGCKVKTKRNIIHIKCEGHSHLMKMIQIFVNKSRDSLIQMQALFSLISHLLLKWIVRHHNGRFQSQENSHWTRKTYSQPQDTVPFYRKANCCSLLSSPDIRVTANYYSTPCLEISLLIKQNFQKDGLGGGQQLNGKSVLRIYTL